MVEELPPAFSVIFGLVIEALKQAFVTRQRVNLPKVVGEKVLAQAVDKLLTVSFSVARIFRFSIVYSNLPRRISNVGLTAL
jgi:hypothetical protein